ncbi:hypothetical protein [Pseudomonas sp. NPDC090201]|uniref:hypothetical protein n=1 Tax=Pseudomonas sp. NPDC090201 TaxID=3364475 RepID=UPI00382BE450
MKSVLGKAGLEFLKKPEKSTTLRIADLVTSTVLSNSGVPGANAAYDFTKLAIDEVRKYLLERQDLKIAKFHIAMLGDNSNSIDETILNSSIDIADYHSLLDACLNDIEMEKNGLYGRLAKSVAKGIVPYNIKRHYILSLKELTWDQIDLLGRLYVMTKHSIKPSHGLGKLEASEAIDSPRAGTVEALNIAALKARGFVYGNEITDFCESFLMAILPTENLTPAAFDFKEWTGHRFSLVELCSEKHETRKISSSIVHHFRDIGIQGGSGPLEGALDRSELGANCSFLIILYQNGKTIPDHRKANLLKIAKTKPIVQVIICETVDEHPAPVVELPFITSLPDATKETLHTLDKKLSELISASRRRHAAP